MNGAAVILLAVLGVPALLWRGYVLTILWGWFIVPLFGVPALSIPLAIGLSLTVAFLTSQRTGNETTEKKSEGEKLLTSLILCAAWPLIALGVGWVVQRFV